MILNTLIRLRKGVYLIRLLTIALAGTGVGKSLFMCHVASFRVAPREKRTLYITMEMAEEKIAERIDANLLDVAYSEYCRFT